MHIKLGDEINNKVVTNISYQSTYPKSAGYSYNTKGNYYTGHKNRVVVTLDDNTELT